MHRFVLLGVRSSYVDTADGRMGRCLHHVASATHYFTLQSFQLRLGLLAHGELAQISDELVDGYLTLQLEHVRVQLYLVVLYGRPTL